ncbi:hypothetical protein MHBO_003091 [Bonamia ostreae]|uniref:Uncharacterized protein n=1 Tax=Bonamia ostreae TaxID=126728 RepID=A0ABV2APH0_9EUKA
MKYVDRTWASKTEKDYFESSRKREEIEASENKPKASMKQKERNTGKERNSKSSEEKIIKVEKVEKKEDNLIDLNDIFSSQNNTKDVKPNGAIDGENFDFNSSKNLLGDEKNSAENLSQLVNNINLMDKKPGQELQKEEKVCKVKDPFRDLFELSMAKSEFDRKSVSKKTVDEKEDALLKF